MKKVVFIGAGNVATHLATELHKYYCIEQVYSRTKQSAKELADKVGATYTTRIEDVTEEADIYVFSLKDSILEEIVSQMPHQNGIWIHTAGSMPISVFFSYAKHYGVLYPFQTFSKNRIVDWKEIPIYIEGATPQDEEAIRNIAHELSDKVISLLSEKRKYIHLSGVFACNFTNHMYALAEKVLTEAGLPFEHAIPLIEETCRKIHTLSPTEAQTGPAVRYDANIMNKHLALLDDELIKEIYRMMSDSIHRTHNNK